MSPPVGLSSQVMPVWFYLHFSLFIHAVTFELYLKNETNLGFSLRSNCHFEFWKITRVRKVSF